MIRTWPIIGCVVSVCLLAACQVQPLHSNGGGNSFESESIASSLQSVEVSDAKTRFDQLVRNELLFDLAGSSTNSGEFPFLLEINTTKSVRSVGISDVDFGPRAFFVTIATQYVLRDARQLAPIAQGRQEGTASYDRVDQEFANIRAERDAEIRAAKATALRLRHAISLALSSRTQG